MPHLPELPHADPTRAFRYRDGLYAVDLVSAALAEFDFFTWLGRNAGVGAGEIGAALGMAARPLDVLLTLGKANGWIAEAGGAYSLTTSGAAFLSADSAWSLAPYYQSLKDRRIHLDMVEVLRSGKPANWGSAGSKGDWHKSMEDDAFADQFTAAMDCRGLYLGKALAAAADLGGRKRLLDVAGGSGIYACCFAEVIPGLEATVFEMPPVDRVAQRAIERRGFSDRVKVATGDMFEDPWPAADAHLISNVLHDWDFPEAEAILRRSAEALPPGGLLIIHDAFIHAAKDGPLPVAEYSCILMHSTQGKCYSVGEYAAMLDRAGFAPGDYADTAADRGFMVGVRRQPRALRPS